ncbi:MAG: hypothetical protein K2Q09_08880, partial [Phycisphaerales bacterium]|nr:hypothetical protein [Phycisphaerales bacterium]
MPDAFDMLGLAARFDLSADDVRSAYLARVGGARGRRGSEEAGWPGVGEEGERHAAALNLAKSTLMNPEARANALLLRLGGPSREVSRELPDGFLAQMMEAREGLESAAAARDGSGVARWTAWAEGERDGYVARVGALFKEFESSRQGR